MSPVWVSAIYGGYDKPKPPPPGVGYLFTDDPFLKAPGWEVILHDPYPHMHPRMKAKAPKCQPHIFLPQEPVTVWVDGSMILTPEAADVPLHPLGFWSHPHRDNIYDEAEVSAGLVKYHGLPVREQVETYKAEGLPHDHGLWASGFHTRDIRVPGVIDFFNRWWHECVLWTYQDQLSLPYARWKARVPIQQLPHALYANPYFTMEAHASDF